ALGVGSGAASIRGSGAAGVAVGNAGASASSRLEMGRGGLSTIAGSKCGRDGAPSEPETRACAGTSPVASATGSYDGPVLFARGPLLAARAALTVATSSPNGLSLSGASMAGFVG